MKKGNKIAPPEDPPLSRLSMLKKVNHNGLSGTPLPPAIPSTILHNIKLRSPLLSNLGLPFQISQCIISMEKGSIHIGIVISVSCMCTPLRNATNCKDTHMKRGKRIRKKKQTILSTGMMILSLQTLPPPPNSLHLLIRSTHTKGYPMIPSNVALK